MPQVSQAWTRCQRPRPRTLPTARNPPSPQWRQGSTGTISSAPTGWKVEFDKKTIDRIAPEQMAEVNALVTPTDKSIAGDYMATIRAASRGESASTQFRVTVATSTVWGFAAFGIIAVALLVMFGAVARFGRR